MYDFINPVEMFRIRKRCCLKANKDGKLVDFTQQEANKLFEGPTLIISSHISNCLALMISALIYLSVLPIGIPIAFMGLFLFYWNLKYLLLKNYKMPQ